MHGYKRGICNSTRYGTASTREFIWPTVIRPELSKAVDVIVLKLGYKNTPYDPKLFCKWIDGMPILVMFHSDDFRWCGPPNMLSEWDALVKAF